MELEDLEDIEAPAEDAPAEKELSPKQKSSILKRRRRLRQLQRGVWVNVDSEEIRMRMREVLALTI